MPSVKLFTATPEQRAEAEKQIRQLQREIRYDTRDFPVETIVLWYQAEKFYVPSYQREFIWSEEKQSMFLESVIMGLPIPMMFVAEDVESIFEIVDGTQRMRSLEAFLDDGLELKGLQKLTSLNGFTFTDLPENQQNKLLSRPLRLVFLEQDTTEENRRDLFERINKSGEALLPSERRRGSFAGPFIDFLEGLARDPILRRLCPISKLMDLRKEPLELVTRFVAYSDHYLEFQHDVDAFLDEFVKRHRHDFPKEQYQSEFAATMQFVAKFFPYGFAKSPTAKTTPRVRFEALSVGANLALRQKPNLVPPPVLGWLESREFTRQTTTHASNSSPRMRGRIEFVRDKLLEGS